MLKKIMFSNILSFEETQMIDFNGEEKVYAIYGKNSAGKTNILTVINFLYSTFNNKLEDIGEISDYACKFNENSVINIAAQFKNNDKNYFYSISIDTKALKYLKQELLEISKSGEQITIFDFENNELKSEVLTKNERGAIKAFNIEDNGVFAYLDEMKKTENIEELLKFSSNSNFQKNFNEACNFLNGNKLVVKEVVNELQRIDIDIDDIDFQDRRNMKKKLLNDIEGSTKDSDVNLIEMVKNIPNFELITIHDEKRFGRHLESTGTNRYIDLLIKHYVEDIGNTDVPRLIYELEMHLHTDVFLNFIEFCKSNTSRQLIFTTHNQEILEKKILQKENIIIVDKENNISEISKLSDFPKLRNDDRHNWKKMYNKYMLGGKPYVN